jgi:hypothetical protein
LIVGLSSMRGSDNSDLRLYFVGVLQKWSGQLDQTML